MNRKHNRRKALWITLFVILVGIGGYALAASGNMENPITSIIGGGEGERRDGPPQGFTDQNSSNSSQPQQNNFQRGEGGNQDSLNWSGIGGVLYNVWFLFAAAAVVVVFQTVGSGIKQMVTQRIPKAASP